MKCNHFKVLIVDHDRWDICLLRNELARCAVAEFDTAVAENLVDAGRRLDRESFDCVLLELDLPGGSGTDGIDDLRTHAAGTPIIVLTKLDEERIGLRAIQAGAEDFLVKGWAFAGGGFAWRSRFREGRFDYLVKDQMDNSSLARTLRFTIERARSKSSAHSGASQDPFAAGDVSRAAVRSA